MAIRKLAKKISVVIFVWMAILGRKKILEMIQSKATNDP
jgi:hypothetical protein